MTGVTEPTKRRWQPLRGGLMNLYLYEDQQFRYEDGRLLLRGNNGTGKSRVLALQLPFLLDGEVAPTRVEPDGDMSKRIEWHLLLGDRYDDRIGYSWLEIGRRDEKGDCVYRTIGCGMHATRGKGAPKRWFFLTDRRIGADLKLRTDSGTPLTARQLRELIGDRDFFEHAADYRAALDRTFFKLGKQRYHVLIELLIQLRRPQLSRKLDEERLSRALSEALPPPSPSVLEDVAEAMRGLEGEQEALDGYRQALKATERFLGSYRAYVQIAVRQAASRVRHEHSEYEKTLRRIRELEATRDEATTKLAALEQDIDANEAAAHKAETEVRTLEQDPAMRDARRLDDARKEEHEARDQAAHAAADVGHAQEGLERANRALTRGNEQLEAVQAATRARLDECLALARETVLADIIGALDGEPLDVDAADRALEERRRQHQHLLTLSSKVDSLAGDVRDIRSQLGNAAASLDAANDELVEETTALNEAGDALIRATSAWANALEEFKAFPTDNVLADLADWLRTGNSESPLALAVADAHSASVKALSEERAELDTLSRKTRSQLDALREEHERLSSGHHAGPPEPPLRAPDVRLGRAGAPLWAVCDFRDHVPGGERAAFEAALQASGLLDAWITPDGELLPEGVDDTAAIPLAATAGPSLTKVLKPAIDRESEQARSLSDAVVERVLAGIASAPEAHVPWVSADGRFRLGPLAGRASKEDAEHVGHGAREQARRRRLMELDAEIAEASEELDRLSAALEQVGLRLRRADEERSAAPSDTLVRDAMGRVVAAERAVGRARERVSMIEAQLEAATEQVRKAEDRLRSSAEDLGLTEWIDALARLGELLAELRGRLPRLRDRLEEMARVREQQHENELAHVRASDALERARTQAHRARKRLDEATTERVTLEATVGAKVAEIEHRLDCAREQRRTLLHQLQALRTTHDQVRTGKIQAEAKLEELRPQLEAATERRNQAATGLRDVARTGLLPVAHDELAEVDTEAEWSPTRAVDIARRADQLLKDVDQGENAWERVSQNVHTALTELQTALLSQQLHPSGRQQASLLVVRVPFRGEELHPAGLQDALSSEIADRQRILDEREREILENHLIGEVSAHLVDLIRGAEQLVGEMNAEIESRPMSTGMRLRFKWEPLPDDEALGRVRRKLLSAHGMWSPEERADIGRFLQGRIQREREGEDAATRTWIDHLNTALDYRAWHRFAVERQQDGTWKRLTRRTYGTGSGGEKAISLTLPQVAAAAAHYRSASELAPRFILFDEAFVGIDSDMRSKCMELLTAFDLDFVMTSEREWGCYATVPGLAIYQLAAQPGIDAVHATRWVWNGRVRSRDTCPDDVAHSVAAE